MSILHTPPVVEYIQRLYAPIITEPLAQALTKIDTEETWERLHDPECHCQSYTTNDLGIITDPGKFEGEPRYVPHFWNFVLNGLADKQYVCGDDDCDDDCRDGGDGADFIIIAQEDVKLFPELADSVDCYLFLEERESGFVDSWIEEAQ